MRVNIKKITLIACSLLFLWLLLSYFSVLEVPRAASPKHAAIEIENRILKLQKQMDEQIADSNKLLEKVKKHLNKNDVMKIDEFEEIEPEIESVQSKFFFFYYSCKTKVTILCHCTIKTCIQGFFSELLA